MRVVVVMDPLDDRPNSGRAAAPQSAASSGITTKSDAKNAAIIGDECLHDRGIAQEQKPMGTQFSPLW